MSLITDLPQDIQFIIAEYGGVLDSLDSSYVVKELTNIYPHVCILREIELLRKIQKIKRVHPKLITLHNEEDRSLLTDACCLPSRMTFSGISRDELEIRIYIDWGVDPPALLEYDEEHRSTPYICVDCSPRYNGEEWYISATLNNRPKAFEIDPWIDHLVNDRDLAWYIINHKALNSNIQDKVALHNRPRTVISSELMDTFRSLGGCVSSLLEHIREKGRVVESMRDVLPDWLIDDITREMIASVQVYGCNPMIYHRTNYKIDRLLDWLKSQMLYVRFQPVTHKSRDHHVVTEVTIELQNETDKPRLKEILNSIDKLCMASVSVMDLI